MAQDFQSTRSTPAKNIVLCCDGTGNEYGDRNSNVIKVYRSLILQRDLQVAYYHPGVGTMGANNALTSIGKAWTKFRGLAFGYGLSQNIADAYQYLMHHYSEGDRIFIFGFSRGAYTARALCGLLEMLGLLSPGNEGLIPYALRLFKSANTGPLARIAQLFSNKPSKFRIGAGFKKTFGQECKPYFLGLWDTVSSVGWILDPTGLKPGRLPYTFALNDVSIIRHAVSLDERRAFFRQNLVLENAKRNMKQVWFPGVHSDVGGSYREAESGLSKISLRWILQDAHEAGLLLDSDMVSRILGDDLAYSKPISAGMMHNSLTAWWWLGEFWPKWTKTRVSESGEETARFRGHPRANLFRRRTVNAGACIHESVLKRQQHKPRYRPTNLPASYKIEPELVSENYPIKLQKGETIAVGVHAGLKWNDTGVQVLAGEQYYLEASGRWYDATISTGAAGYKSPNVFFRLLESLRRASRADWFALIGAIGEDAATQFVIGPEAQLNVEREGILQCFANDLPLMYWNNSGYLKLTIGRIA